ncbi:unnamed protein product [Clonostachys chloroleuca]|uniref:Uncharacterized protein n=1 Tax=Clonostachys chloroleuca TaxID=1926264 RepID=A0AA35PUF7_9HYPO|nr:unnamed protein product [Clonostachys chloroleuca]
MDDVDPIKRREIEARELRRAILDRLEQYRQLQSLVPSHAIDQQVVNPDNAFRLETTRTALLRDLHQLSSMLLTLEKKIDDKRWMKWILPPFLGMIGYFLLMGLYKLPYFRQWSPDRKVNEQGKRRPLFLNLLALLPWITRPLAAFKIFMYERRRMQTTRLQESVDELESQVESGSPFQDDRCLAAKKWDRIPWDECKDVYDRAFLYLSTGL